MWDPLCFSATVEASNFKFGTQIGFGTSLPKKRRLGPKLAGVWARGASKKIWDRLLISATVEASNFKFGRPTQLGFGTSLAKNNVLDQNWRGVGQGSIRKKWDTLRIFATIEASNFKFGTQLGFGTSLPKTTFRTKIGGGLGQESIQKNLGPPMYFCNR